MILLSILKIVQLSRSAFPYNTTTPHLLSKYYLIQKMGYNEGALYIDGEGK
jgi:hypothetical protein